jgi:hypothetical protein
VPASRGPCARSSSCRSRPSAPLLRMPTRHRAGSPNSPDPARSTRVFARHPSSANRTITAAPPGCRRSAPVQASGPSRELPRWASPSSPPCEGRTGSERQVTRPACGLDPFGNSVRLHEMRGSPPVCTSAQARSRARTCRIEPRSSHDLLCRPRGPCRDLLRRALNPQCAAVTARGRLDSPAWRR